MSATPEEQVNVQAEQAIHNIFSRLRKLESNDYFRPSTGEGTFPLYLPTDAQITAALGTPQSYNGNMVALVTDSISGVNYFVFGDNVNWYYMRMNSAGGAVGNGARVWSDVNVTIPDAVYTPVAFTDVDYDANDFFSLGSPTRLTITEGGFYSIKANVRWNFSGFGYLGLKIRRSGTGDIAYCTTRPLQVDPTDMIVVADQGLAAGEYIELLAYQNSGAPLDLDAIGGIGAALPWLSIARIF